jgi:hypothetical protein
METEEMVEPAVIQTITEAVAEVEVVMEEELFGA